MSDKIGAPLTYGILRPVILLPQDTNWANEEELSFVLAHEFVHINLMGRQVRGGYAMTLIGMAERNRHIADPLHSNFNKYAIEERINAIWVVVKRNFF